MFLACSAARRTSSTVEPLPASEAAAIAPSTIGASAMRTRRCKSIANPSMARPADIMELPTSVMRTETAVRRTAGRNDCQIGTGYFFGHIANAVGNAYHMRDNYYSNHYYHLAVIYFLEFPWNVSK